jgi:gamma-D-glutamyl-L-lysine dipeptidyl-peptidase
MPGIAAFAIVASVLPGAVVLQPVVNMYAGPSKDAPVVSQAAFGANVDLVEPRGDWARIRTADDYTGFIPLAALRVGRSYATQGRVAEVQSLSAHLYREADVTRHEPLVTVPFETRLEVLAEPPDTPGWLQVRLPDDRSAWVQAGDVAFNPKPLGIGEMLELSKRFLGRPYTYGGTTSFGYDCSGFAQMLCRRRGVIMPRDARLQAAWSGVVPVERKDMAPGDLLYFGVSDTKITHTGIYLGDGKFISATCFKTPTIHVDDLKEARGSRLLVAVRRLKL